MLLACFGSVSELALASGDVLARVGSIVIDRASFERRAARLAAPYWPALGPSWAEQRRRLLDDVLVADALLAESLATAAAPGAPAARDRALALALEDELARAAAGPVDAAELAAYAARHARELASPRSLLLWRILLPSEAEARATIASLTPPTEAAFSRLARDVSTDTATRMRAGNLGRVFADGDTAVPELRVSPALFAAADRVRDGELVAEPVAEGAAFAVVWRRASYPERRLPAPELERWLTARLLDERRATSREALLVALRREFLADHHPERAASYAPVFTEPASPRARIAPEPPRAAVRLAPEPTDRGLR